MTGTVLVVDDTRFTRLFLCGILERAGYTTHQAASGMEALHQFREVRPDVITLDLMLPDMSGLDVLRRIRETGVPVKVVVVSAHSDSAHVSRAACIGVDDFLVKPIVAGRMLETMERLMEGISGS